MISRLVSRSSHQEYNNVVKGTLLWHGTFVMKMSGYGVCFLEFVGASQKPRRPLTKEISKTLEILKITQAVIPFNHLLGFNSLLVSYWFEIILTR